MQSLLIDNYDSFTYNLARQISRTEGRMPTILRNDEMSPTDLAAFGRLYISPGPGIPKEAGRLMELLAQAVGRMPLLGVCLGMQAIAEHFGGSLVNLPLVYHGVQHEVVLTDPNHALLRGLPVCFPAGRYHSWAVDAASISGNLRQLATDGQKLPMILAHPTLPVFGLQFHPESIMTLQGDRLIQNFTQIQNHETRIEPII